MTTAPYICSAPAGFEVAYVVGEDELLTTPMVAWEIVGLHAVPLALFSISNVIAVIFPDGQVVDLDSKETWADLPSWREQWSEVDRKLGRVVRRVEVTAAPVETITPHTDSSLEASKSIRDLGLSGRATAPMERAGINYVKDLAGWNRKDVLDIKGVPANAGKTLDEALAAEGLSWLGIPPAGKPIPVAPAVEDEDDDDLEDMI